MSDADDGFDKEAEREKLREKYEQDRQQREMTEHMSDLLLKGATMTNTHCDDCGSPIFRYEGEAFCPTCAGTRDVEGGESDGADGTGAAGGQAGQASGGGQDATDARAQDASDARAPGAGDARGDDTQAPGQGAAGPRSGDEAGQPRRATGQPSAGANPPGSGDADGDDIDLEAARSRLDERASARSDVGGRGGRADPPVGDSPVRQGEVPSMAQTRASLRRAIISLSEQAAQSDDPTRAQHLLKGAREGSEALAALDGTAGE